MSNEPPNKTSANEQPAEPIILRIAKGGILGVWILLLGFFAGLASTGSASKEIVKLFRRDTRVISSDLSTPQQFLRQYLRLYDDPKPPLSALLNLMTEDPNWRECNVADMYKSGGGTAEQEKERRIRWVKEQYDDLFSRADNEIQAILSDKSIDLNDPKGIAIQAPKLPGVFQGQLSNTERTIRIPRVVTQWVVEQRVRDDLKKQRDELVDTFFLLMVLGAFGSLIFLTKEFIDQDRTTTCAAFIFRPIFGIFLAMAMFVLDMLAHSVVSTSSVLQVRHETLYILALASGILAEQAYTIVSGRAQSFLEKMREKANGADSSGGATTTP